VSESEQNNELRGLQEHYAFVRHAWVTQDGPYGLEEHLKSFRDTSGYEELCASWGCDKVKYREALPGNDANNPHFSRHGEAHSKQIIAAMELLLGEKRIRQLSASDTWLLLQCAYTHDSGMAISAKDMVKSFAKEGPGFLKKMKETFESTNNKDALAALRFIQPILKLAQTQQESDDTELFVDGSEAPRSRRMDAEKKWEVYRGNPLLWPSDFIEMFTTVQESWFRAKHAENSRQILEASAYKNSKEEAIISLRLRLTVARIAALHAEDTEKILDLPQETLGACNDYVHPRFAAILLRLGDLLDMDNGRFSRTQLLRIGGENEGTLIHLFKHEAITHFLVTPLDVEVKANFDPAYANQLLKEFNMSSEPRENQQASANEDAQPSINANQLCMKACQELYRWLDFLEKELNFFALNWLEIVPRKMEGGCPTYHKPTLCIDNRRISPKELQLKYCISTKRASEIIEGSGLYLSPKKVFLRELLQNALDATKLQMHRDVMSGRYPAFAAADWSLETADLCRLTPYCYLEKLAPVLNQYRLEYDVRIVPCPETNSAILKILLRDYGTGINEAALRGMLHIGDIQIPDLDMEIEKMPSWLKPTRSFGIGLQSVFYVAKSFTIRSRAQYEKSQPFAPLREMQFYSNRFGGEIDVQLRSPEESARFGFGTEVCIEIPIKKQQNQFDLLQGQSFDVFDSTLQHLKAYFCGEIEKIETPQFLLPLVQQMPQQASLCKPADSAETTAVRRNQPETFLQEVFGDFCVLLLKDRKPLLKPEQPYNLRNDWFSCWDDEKQLLLVYRRVQEPQNSLYSMDVSRVSVFYKGIEIRENGANLRGKLCIPFWEVEIHMYAEEAKDWLEINREAILEERVNALAHSVGETHLKLLRYLFSNDAQPPAQADAAESDEEKPTPNKSDEKSTPTDGARLKSVWEPMCKNPEKQEYYALARLHSAYYVSLLDASPQAERVLNNGLVASTRGMDSCIPGYFYVPVGKMLRYIDTKSIQSPSGIETALCASRQNGERDSLWFINPGILAGMDHRITGIVPETAVQLFPHLFPRYKTFAATRFFALQLSQGVEHITLPCFRVGKRTGRIVASTPEDFWRYVLALIRKGEDGARPVFPSNELFEDISVTEIPPDFASEEMRIFDSWIIAPLQCKTLREFLAASKAADDEQRKQLLEDFLPEEWLETHKMLLRFVRYYKVSPADRKRSEKEMSKKEKCEILLSYREFLRNLQKYG